MNKSCTYLGQEQQIEILRENLTQPHGAVSFNIIGARGSGKRSLIDFIAEKLRNRDKNPDWKTDHSYKNVEPITIDGRGFRGDGSFRKFLMGQLCAHFGGTLDREDWDSDAVIDKLRLFTRNDTQVIVFIDNFEEILARMREDEALGLNALLQPRLFYVFVTDHRSIREINLAAAEASDIFQGMLEIHLEPLQEKEARDLVDCAADELGEVGQLVKKHRDKILDLGGRHPGLLRELVRVLHYEIVALNELNKNGGARSNGYSPTENPSFLRLLPEREGIRYYLSHLVQPLQELPVKLKEVVIALALRKLDSSDPLLRNRKFLQKLRDMGIISFDHQLEPMIHGKLLQYTVLETLAPVSFSEAEQTAFNLLMRARPIAVSFDDLEKVLARYMTEDELKSANGSEKEKDRTPSRRFVEGTINRVRRKLLPLDNATAFGIENERGHGFYLSSTISFDAFCQDGPRAFQGH